MNKRNEKINRFFPGLVVRKDLVKTVKGNAIVPTYVLEYLLGQYCATSDDDSIQSGIETVKEILRQHYVHRNEAGLIRSTIKEKGRHKVIDKIRVALNDKNNAYEATFDNLGIKKVLVDSDTIKKHPRLLVSGVWCIADLEYEFVEDKNVTPWQMESIKPIQLSHFDYDSYIEARKAFSTDEWLDLLMQSIGFDPGKFDRRSKLLQVVRLIPYCERNYNLIELGPKGTGKSHIYSEFSPHGILISGGEVTVPKLFVSNSSGRIGLVGYWDTVAFDEFAGKKKRVDKARVDIMKNYMANKSFSRGVETLGAEASMVFVGNTRHTLTYMLKHTGLFDELPEKYLDSAFLDRLHFYIPGWEVDIIRGEMFSDGYGFVVDYLAEILRSLRNHDYSLKYKGIGELFSDISTRDRDGINKTFSGLMKILYPHDEATEEEVEELLRFAIEGRKRVKDQLMRIDATYAGVHFGYEKKDGTKVLIKTREQEEFPQHYTLKTGENREEPPLETAKQKRPPKKKAPEDSQVQPPEQSSKKAAKKQKYELFHGFALEELLEKPESQTLEFKSSLDWDVRQKMQNTDLRQEVLKTVVAFLNSEGGTLLVGVEDNGNVFGLGRDLKLSKNKNLDGFEQKLMSLISSKIGEEYIAYIKARFEETEGKQVCILEVDRAAEPAYLEEQGVIFYIRTGNITQSLDTRKAIKYQSMHWPS
ncbi:MAG: BREX system Lon protease-like protein BrxL [bacterium]|nr:BREX system Lon protease-like protein BrxL [bacterium]